jgi:hypothetical protein
MSDGGEPKQNSPNQLRSPMSDGGEPKQNSPNQLRSPMSDGGEPKQNSPNQLRSPMCVPDKDSRNMGLHTKFDIYDFYHCWNSS